MATGSLKKLYSYCSFFNVFLLCSPNFFSEVWYSDYMIDGPWTFLILWCMFLFLLSSIWVSSSLIFCWRTNVFRQFGGHVCIKADKQLSRQMGGVRQIYLLIKRQLTASARLSGYAHWLHTHIHYCTLEMTNKHAFTSFPGLALLHPQEFGRVARKFLRPPAPLTSNFAFWSKLFEKTSYSFLNSRWFNHITKLLHRGLLVPLNH